MVKNNFPNENYKTRNNQIVVVPRISIDVIGTDNNNTHEILTPGQGLVQIKQGSNSSHIIATVITIINDIQANYDFTQYSLQIWSHLQSKN